MKIKIQCSDGGKLPNYAYTWDAGMDLFAADSCVIRPGEVKAVRTGIKMAIPGGYAGLVWDKSGLAAKRGIKTMAGVVDSGYRGEVLVVLSNLSKEDFAVEKGMKIAQMLIQKVERADIEHVDFLEESDRGEGGFGSTGR